MSTTGLFSLNSRFSSLRQLSLFGSGYPFCASDYLAECISSMIHCCESFAGMYLCLSMVLVPKTGMMRVWDWRSVGSQLKRDLLLGLCFAHYYVE